MTKVMKYELRYLDGAGDFSEMQKRLWSLSDDIRSILNQTVQMWVEWDFKSRRAKEETGEYLDCLTETGQKQFRGHIYSQLSKKYQDVASNCLLAAVNKGDSKYRNAKKEILRGDVSIPSYRKGQPIPVQKQCVKLNDENGDRTVSLTLFSMKYKQKTGLKGNVRFSVKASDKTQRAVFDRCVSGEYSVSESQIVYDRPKWFLILSYSFTPGENKLDDGKILGVDVGQAYAIYASSFGNRGVFKIEGGEVEEYAKRKEAKTRAMQNQAKHCGDGRVGHGTKKRVEPMYKSGNKIANYRDTINHIYSRELVRYAVKNGYGVIQMEDLSGIKSDKGFQRRLIHWTYYDLQAKIESKCREAGIKFVKVPAMYTSQRCSRCGNIDSANRQDQATFCCTSCGFAANADYNASQNISIKGIGTIIEQTLCAKVKQA